MSINDLNEQELFIYKWKKGCLGGFKTALVEAIAKADPINQTNLLMGFPMEVSAFTKYSEVDGWWQNVLKKMGEEEN